MTTPAPPPSSGPSPAPTTPVRSGVPSSPSPVLGTSDLQKAIDKFDTAVNKLTALYNKASGSGLPQNGTGNGGLPGSNSGSSQKGNGGYTAGHFGSDLANAMGIQLPKARGPAARMGSNSGMTSNWNSNGGNGSGFMGQHTSGGQPMGQSGTAGTYGGSGGGFVAPGSSGQSSGGGGGSNGQGSGTGGLSGGGYIASGILSMVSGLTSFGTSSQPTQLSMSSFQQQGTLLAPSNVSNFGAYGNQMRAAAFGQPSSSSPPNNFAMSAQDAAQGYGTLQQLAGSGIASANSYGRFGLQGAASFAGANPGMSYSQAAQMAASMATPGMSLQMRQLGYGTTPLNMGGGASSFGSTVGGMMNRWYGQQAVSPQTLAASLRPGVGVGWANLQSLGMNSQQTQAMTSTMEAYNQVAYRGKMSDSQVQNLFTQAQGGNKGALSTLSKYGVTQSDISQLKKQTAQGTETQSDIYNSYTSGLTAATSALSRFQAILNKIVNLPGINQIVGGGSGALSTMSSLSGDFKDVGEGAFGLGMTGIGAYKMLSRGKGLQGLLGLMDPEDVAAIQAGKYLPGILGGLTGNSSAGNPLGGMGSVKATNSAGGNGSWNVNTMNVKARTVNISTGGAGGSGSGSGPSIGGGSGGGSGGILGGFSGVADKGGQILDKLIKNDHMGGGSSIGNSILSWLFGSPGKGQTGTGGGARTPSQVSASASSNSAKKTNSVSGQAREAVSDAETQLGVPYVWGGETPGVGFDCSGLVQWAYKQAGVSLPRTSQQQWASLKGKRSINPSDVEEGDLIFMAGSDGTTNAPGHVAMMISSNRYVEAPYTGADVREGAYNPKDWTHAARPAGNVTGAGSNGSSGSSSGGGGTSGQVSATGAGGGMNSTSEASNVSGALGGGAGGVSLGMTGGGGAGASTKSASTGSGTSTGTTMGTLSANAIEKLWTSLGGPSAAKVNMARIAYAESGDRPSAKQQGQPPQTTGWGLYQITPTSGINQNGKFGNLLNASNNTKAAIYLYKSSGYSPWSSDSVGASLTGYAAGGTTPGGPVIVGERGPEVANLPAGTQIMDAGSSAKVVGAQGVAQVPWSAPPIGAVSNGSGISVNLQFAANAIVISNAGAGSSAGTNSKQSAANNAREIVSKVKEALQSEAVYTAIRSGQKGG